MHAIALLQPIQRLVERADQRPQLARHRGLGQPRLQVARRDARRGVRRAPQRQQEVAQRAVDAEGEQQQRHRGDQQRVLQDRADDGAAEQRGRAVADGGLHDVAFAVVRQRLRDHVQRQAVDDDVEALARRVGRRERRRAGVRGQHRDAASVDHAVLPVARRRGVDPGRVGRLAQRHRFARGIELEVRLDPVHLLAQAVRQGHGAMPVERGLEHERGQQDAQQRCDDEHREQVAAEAAALVMAAVVHEFPRRAPAPAQLAPRRALVAAAPRVARAGIPATPVAVAPRTATGAVLRTHRDAARSHGHAR